jgi:hypothetical protein
MYLDKPIIDGFQAVVIAQMAVAIEFAVNTTTNDPEGAASDDELRQAAQDALVELMTPLVDSMNTAYTRAYQSDPEAVAYLFSRLATRARLKSLCVSPRPVNMYTRKGTITGVLTGMGMEEGEEVAYIGDLCVPVVSITEIAVLEESSATSLTN